LFAFGFLFDLTFIHPMKYTSLPPSSLPFSTAALARLWRWGVAAVVGSLALGAAQANMIVDTTRVIYPEARREVSFRVTNTAKDRPGFVQMWLDDGNANVAPEDATSPFNLTPPIARLGADGSQVVRLVYTGEPLPADRESVFYFNMLEVPQKSAEENKISFAVRTRIKVFFRPKALRADPMTLMNKVSWQLVKEGGNWVAVGTNPTPFHMSFFAVLLGQSGKFGGPIDGGMIPPMGKSSIVLGEVDKIPDPTKAFNQIKVDFVNDYGGATSLEFPLSGKP
jgi:chaperone protein EcpD